MIVEYVVVVSDTPTKIGTLTTRELRINERSDVPDRIPDGAQAISIDRKSVQTTIVATYQRISVTYLFPVDELYLDNEFRDSANFGQTMTLDTSDYEWLDDSYQIVLDLETVTTQKVGCTHYRRSFNALVVG